MGLFDSIDYEKMMQDIREIWGADDRMTGMIPDTYDDPSGVDSYGKRYLDRMIAPFGRAWDEMPRTGDMIRYGNELKKGFLEGAPNYPAGDGYADNAFGEDYQPSLFSPYMTEDGVSRFGLDDPTSPNRMSINSAPTRAREWIRDNNELAEWFSRGVALSDDGETFIDRKRYLDDGTVGSEETARSYKMEGAGELLRGIGYGVTDTADAMLGLVTDEDSLIRRPTRRMLDMLSYENTGDAEVDVPLDTIHSLGEGIGETIATGGVTGAVKSGIKRLAPYISGESLAKSPVWLRNNTLYRMRDKVEKIPHLEDIVNTRLGNHILDFVSDGVVNTAMIRQLASRENWSSEEFEQAIVASTILATIGLGRWTRPKAEPKSVSGSTEWIQPRYIPVENPFGKRYDEIAAEAKPQIKYEGRYDKKKKKWQNNMPLTAQHEKETGNPIYQKIRTYDFVPNERMNAKKRALLSNGNPIMPGVEQYPQPPYATIGKLRADKSKERTEAWQAAFDEDNARAVPDFENEELKVDVANSITDWGKEKRKKKFKKKKGSEKIEPFVPNVPLMPSDTLIMEKELERVFGKHAILEETATNKYHVTLPNGVELNVQSYNEIPVGRGHIRNIGKRYGFPNRTVFSLKGNLRSVDSYALIQLRDLRDSDTLQHQAVHLAMKTVTTRKEKETLRKLFGPKEENQVAGVMQAIREERERQAAHPNVFMRKILRRIEEFGNYVNDFTKNVPTALAKRDWSYLTGKKPTETLRDYAKSFVDGTIWGHDIAPVMRELIDSHRESVAKAIAKENSRWFIERSGLTIYDRSPNIVSILGKSDKPLLIDSNIFNKILLEKHGDEISPEILSRVPQELEHPVLIIRGDWEPGKYEKDTNVFNFILGLKDNYGSNVMVPIGFDYRAGSDYVNKIKSVYGLNSMSSRYKHKPKFDIKNFMEMLKSDKLAYVDREKALELVRVNSPKDYVAMRDYLYRELSDSVFTPEKYRAWRNRRGMKAEMEQEEYFDRGM